MASVMVTVCTDVYVPAGTLNAGVAVAAAEPVPESGTTNVPPGASVAIVSEPVYWLAIEG